MLSHKNLIAALALGTLWLTSVTQAQKAAPEAAAPAQEEAAPDAIPDQELGADEPAADAAPAEEAPAAEASASLSVDGFDGDGEEPAGDESGAFLIDGKVGGIVSLNGLSPFVHVGLDVGYVFGVLNRGLGAYLSAEYTVPRANGSLTEDTMPSRISGGSYKWKITQKELVLQPTLLYRATWMTDVIVPFVGIGPRVYMLQSVVEGSSGGQKFMETKENSTKFGFGVPLGVEVPLGPGGLLAEFLFQWGPFKHRTTGDTNLGGLSLFLGYRALL